MDTAALDRVGEQLDAFVGEHLTDKRIQLFPGTVESGCIHARMLSRKSRKLEPTRRANKVLLGDCLETSR